MIAYEPNGATERIVTTIRRRHFGFAINSQLSTGRDSGYDAGKKVKGRKRSLIVDTLGLLLAVSISAASVQDRDAADDAVAYSKEKYPSLNTLFVDSAYAGKWAQRMNQTHAVDVQVIRGPNNRRTGKWHSEQGDMFAVAPAPTGFVVMPKRWVVERTHAWNERARRLIMHHDRLFAVSEAWVWLAEARCSHAGSRLDFVYTLLNRGKEFLRPLKMITSGAEKCG